MKRLGMILIGMLIVGLTQAQNVFDFTETSDGRIIVVPARPEFRFNFTIPEFNFSQYTPSSVYEMEKLLQEIVVDFESNRIEERPMDIRIRSTAYQPFYDPYATMRRSMSPMAYDFSEAMYMPLGENFGFVMSGVQYTWPGMGGLTEISPSLVYHNEQLTLTGSGFAGRFYTPFNVSPGFTAGAGIDARFEINERIALRGWGQYAAYKDGEYKNPHMLMNPSYNHTGVGGAVELMINENFGVGMGVNYEYNPWKRKLEPQYLVYPIFRK